MKSILLLGLGALFQLSPPGSADLRIQPSLEPAATRFAQAWQGGDVETLLGMMPASGIRLHLPGEEHASLPPRRVRAALRELLGRLSGGETQISRLTPAGGDPTRGFADIRWRTVARAETEAVTFSLFVAFALQGEVWQVTEIRLLSPSTSV